MTALTSCTVGRFATHRTRSGPRYEELLALYEQVDQSTAAISDALAALDLEA